MADFWPQETGAIFDAGSYILPCYPDDTISELSSVKVGTTASGRISVTVSAAMGDGIGVALKAATSAGVPSRIPVLFYGAVKVTTSGTGYNAFAGSYAMNSITTTFCALGGAQDFADLSVGGGASHHMGMFLQTAASVGDSVVLLVGKCI